MFLEIFEKQHELRRAAMREPARGFGKVSARGPGSSRRHGRARQTGEGVGNAETVADRRSRARGSREKAKEEQCGRQSPFLGAREAVVICKS